MDRIKSIQFPELKKKKKIILKVSRGFPSTEESAWLYLNPFFAEGMSDFCFKNEASGVIKDVEKY